MSGAGEANAPKKTRRVKRDYLDLLREGPNPPDDLLRDKPAAEQELLKKHWVSLKSYSHMSKVQSVFNVRLTSNEITSQLDAIFQVQKNLFKINASLGYVLRHKTTAEFRYYHSCINNSRIWETPFLIENPQDFETFVKELEKFTRDKV